MLKNKPIVAFLGTYPPRECGIATFTQDLLNSSRAHFGNSVTCKVAAFNHSPLDTYAYPKEVGWEINQNNKKEYSALAHEFNQNERISGVIVNHEYGIFGGTEGEYILAFLEACQKPVVVTLHTVLPHPSEKMKEVTNRIIRAAKIVVVLTDSSRHILESVYPDAVGKAYVIPHGIHATEFASPEMAKKKLKLPHSTILSTFGLLSRGKGIEYVLRALPEVIKKYPDTVYLILGETHPSVRRQEGESYRLELAELVTKLRLKKHVKFYDQYLDLDDLIEFLKATDIYISTSINPNQAVSGTLSYALGTGRAVISTDFTQAREIITPQTGRLVPIQDSKAMTAALLDLLDQPERLRNMHRQAYDSTRSMLWRNVAQEYARLLEFTITPLFKLDHLKKMTDSFGLFQFALLDTPHPDFGYTLDDNARALLVCNQLCQNSFADQDLDLLTQTYLNFIQACQTPEGNFLNYLGVDRSPTWQNETEDLSDANARALWAVGEVMSTPEQSSEIRAQARSIFIRALPLVGRSEHIRAKAFALKGLIAAWGMVPTHQEEIRTLIERLSTDIADAYQKNTSPTWQWFESDLSYNNAVLPESLFLAGTFLKSPGLIEIGVASLQFLIKETFSSNYYAPIGHAGWYERGEERSYFDQQPEDPCSTILALSTAYKITGQDQYQNLARKCFSWFLGNNNLRLALYNPMTGGCYDGLHPDRVNLNQGAESLVSYLLSQLAITELD